MAANPLTSHKPLVIALVLSLILVGGFATALILDEDLRRYTIAQIEEITNEEGEKVKRVKIEKPEPNEKQVREISRNQERKKREELKEKAKELRETVFEIEEVVEAQKKLKELPETEWDRIAQQAQDLAEAAKEFNEHLQAIDAPANLETAEPEAESLEELVEEYAELINEMKDSAVTEEDAKKASLAARNLRNKANSFQSKFDLATSQSPTEDKAAATELRDEFRELAQQINEHYKEMAEFEKSDHMLQIMPEPETEETDLTELQLDDQLGVELTAPIGEETPLGNELLTDDQLEELNTAELYQEIQKMSEMVDEAFAEGKATELAQEKGMSLEQARDEVYKPESDKGPDLGNALSQNNPSTREEFQQFNEALKDATKAAEQMSRSAANRKSALTGESGKQGNQGQSSGDLQAQLAQKNEIQAKMNLLAQNAGRGQGNVQDMRGLMAENYSLNGGGLNGGGQHEGQAASMSYQTDMSQNALPSKVRLDAKRTLAQAIPGRRLDMNSKRQGWIFLDTWYVIGPWQRPKRKDSFAVKFPPETLIDLDATYEGKMSRYRKERMELKWRFVQTENIRINPPDEINDAVYYGYTEVFCEAATEVTVAVASDDMAKLWINDLVVYEDSGLSGWQMDEGFRTILLKPGYNKVLIRLENGPVVCFFSVLMCPTEALRN
ncbi:hypothetical protein [Cerasicoccus maritimus]|uniref:hypothetical protein n=1 Tax=Cerasicoccus maritimus TaxID=490089 RepID=UPI002852A515|nr:hypothetical protein [Cerasicoccus maritimus]